MEGNVRTLLRRFCLESTYLGIKYLVLYPDVISRSFWIVNVIIANIMAGLLSYKLYGHFLDLPTRITIENQYEPINDISLPSITICTPNQITTRGAEQVWEQLELTNQTALNPAIVLPKVLAYFQLQSIFMDHNVEKFQQNLDKRHLAIPELLGMLPQRCEDFLKYCQLHGRTKSCADLFQPILTHVGFCCVFNNIYYYGDDKRNEDNPYFKNYLVSGGGTERGLTVVLDYEPDGAINGTIINAGVIRVLINHWSEFPATDEAVLVHGNSETFHLLTATYTYCSEDVERLPAWNRKCVFKHEMSLPYFENYHNTDCDLSCIVKAIEERCDCSMFFVPGVRFDRVCNTTKLQCILIAKSNLNKYLQEGKCDCPRDCVSLAYKADVTFGNLDGVPYLMQNPYTGVHFKNSTAIMHFFFSNTVYAKQKQETVTSLITVVSNLGGVYGLCFGCSVMTILEIAFYVYSAIKNDFTNKKRMNKN